MSVKADALLQRLANVRGRNGRWRATCPTHGSGKNQALAVHETTDGRVLVKCFAGCDTEQILGTLGLTWADVMPERLSEGPLKPLRRAFTLRELGAALDAELHLIWHALGDLAHDRPIPPERRERTRQAQERVAAYLHELRGAN